MVGQRPYILFKSKNVKPEVRQAKWKKARPIAPGTKHPMRRLLGLVGRAWSFVAADMPGDHFVIKSGNEVPRFLDQAGEQLKALGELSVSIKDITGCFPNMPQEVIRFAMRDVAARIKAKRGYEGVTVPRRSKTQACSWKRDDRRRDTIWIPFETMLDVMSFALDHAIVKLPTFGGRGEILLRQVEGIPMGCATSPGC